MKEILRLPPGCDGAVSRHRNRGSFLRMHRHAELELNLVTAGRAVYLLDERRVICTRHTSLWLFPRQDHVLLDQSPDFEMWILVWRPRLVRRVCVAPATRVLRRAKPTGNFCRQLAEVSARRLGALVAELLPAADDPARFNAGLAYALLTAWTVHRAAPATSIAGPAVHPAVERAAHLLYSNPTLALNAVAQQAGLSSSRLSRLFKIQTGVALVDYRNRQRVDRFLALLAAQPRRKLIDIALDAGFGSYPQFHRIFRRVMGCSPLQYRQTTLC